MNPIDYPVLFVLALGALVLAFLGFVRLVNSLRTSVDLLEDLADATPLKVDRPVVPSVEHSPREQIQTLSPEEIVATLTRLNREVSELETDVLRETPQEKIKLTMPSKKFMKTLIAKAAPKKPEPKKAKKAKKTVKPKKTDKKAKKK